MQQYKNDLVDDIDLDLALAEAYFYLGDPIETQKCCERILNKSYNYFAAELLAISKLTVGNWFELEEFISEAWRQIENIEYKNILRVADFAVKINSKLARSLISYAGEKALLEKDATSLVSAYSLATNINFENDKSFSWFSKALELSDDEGPIQRKDLSFIIDHASTWSESVNKADKLHKTAQVPYAILCSFLNRTITEFYLLNPQVNEQEVNPANRSMILSHAGKLSQYLIEPKKIAVDVTSIYVLYLIGNLHLLFALYEEIYIAHSTITTMFDDLSKLRHHQPSQVRKSRKLVELFSLGKVKTSPNPAITYHNLALEIGEGIAAMFVEAKSRSVDFNKKAFVLTSYPVKKCGLIEEIADIALYENQIIGCVQVIDYFKQEGLIDDEKYENCLQFLKDKNSSGPIEGIIDKNCELFIDGVSWSYLDHLNLINELVHCGFDIFIDREELIRANMLVKYYNQSSDLEGSVYEIAETLFEQIKTGKVKIAKRLPQSRISDFKNDLVVGLLEEINEYDAVIFDDRALNKWATASNREGISKPVLTTIDVLLYAASNNLIKVDDVFKSISKLRRMNFSLIAVSCAEILFCVDTSKIINGVFKPGWYFKSLYSNIKSIQSSKELVAQEEIEFVLSLSRALVDAIHYVWLNRSCDEAIIVSNKLFEVLDLSLWSGALRHTSFNYLISGIPFHIYMLFYSLPDMSREIKEKYWEWVDRDVVCPLKEFDPEIYSKLAIFFEPMVSKVANEIRELENRDE